MTVELKIAILTIVGALVGSGLGAYATLGSQKQQAGSEWDLKRTDWILKAARESMNNEPEPGYGGWACYHSILWDCVNQQWSVTNREPSSDALSRLCPPNPATEYKIKCPVREVGN